MGRFDKLERARTLGVLKDGWRLVDYCLDTVPKFGWLCAIIWGEKGVGKSALLLQHGYTMFHRFDEFEEDSRGFRHGVITDWTDLDAWKKTMDYVVFRPADFSKLLGTVLKEKKRLAWVGWDDINIHFPRSMYSTNRRIWEQFSRNWEGFRANLSVFECSAPRKDTVVSFILKDMNWDVLVSGRKKVETVRWFWDRDLYEPEKVLKMRLDVDDQELDIGRIPRPVWDEYWKRKVQLIEESTEDFQKMLEDLDRPASTKASLGGFSCEVCGKECANEYNLKVHKLKHQGRVASGYPPKTPI